jgi:hypothetical protein
MRDGALVAAGGAALVAPPGGTDAGWLDGAAGCAHPARRTLATSAISLSIIARGIRRHRLSCNSALPREFNIAMACSG